MAAVAAPLHMLSSGGTAQGPLLSHSGAQWRSSARLQGYPQSLISRQLLQLTAYAGDQRTGGVGAAWFDMAAAAGAGPAPPAGGNLYSRASRLVTAAAGMGLEPSLVSLPVFPLGNCLHPTQEGVLSVFEPRYLAMFHALLREHRGSSSDPPGKGARFLHILSPTAAPPALLEGAVGGLPPVGVCAEVQSIQMRADGTLLVHYSGTRRVQLLLVEERQAEAEAEGLQGGQAYQVAAAQWYDDADVAELDPTVDVLEQEAAKLLQQIKSLSEVVAPGSSGLPAAVAQYAPPAVQKKTSYDALKAAGHRAAGHIDMWRRHGSVYKSQGRSTSAAADPYQAIHEALGKRRRQELFSFAASQLLDMGTPERAALLLSQDTGARLNFLLTALRPYFLELQAKASLKRGLQ